MTPIDQAQRELAETLTQMGDGFEQYSYLIECSLRLPPMPEEEKREDRLVRGCQSKVWLACTTQDGVFSFEGDSDTLIMKGVLYLLRVLLNGRPVREVAQASIWFFGQTEILVSFDAQRQKGIGSIIRTLQAAARAAVPCDEC